MWMGKVADEVSQQHAQHAFSECLFVALNPRAGLLVGGDAELELEVLHIGEFDQEIAKLLHGT